MSYATSSIQFGVDKPEHITTSMHSGPRGQETDPRESMYLRFEVAGVDPVMVTFHGPGGALVALLERAALEVEQLLADAASKTPCADATCKHARIQHGSNIPYACSACPCPAFDEGRTALKEPFRSMTEEEARNWHIRRDERNGRHTP